MQKKRTPCKGRSRWLLPAALMLAGAAWFENFTLTTSTLRAQSASLPAAFSGLRVVQISDLHGRAFDADSRYLLTLTRLQDPDIIALTGDLVDEFTDLSMLPPLLAGLTELAPTFYVTGNHEWVLSAEKRNRLFSMLDSAGVIRLQNEYRLLHKGAASIVLAGVDDPNGPYDQKRPAQLVREIRQDCGKSAYILMLSHRNDELELWAHTGVQTVLCGHGHGGIVRLPFAGAVFGTHLDLFPDYTAGLYQSGQTQMIVSRGLGGSRKLPFRIGNRPEIVTVILETESGNV